jgi:hypothetical protein
LKLTKSPFRSRMASLDLDKEIAALKAEIEGYKLRLNDATSAEDIRMWAGLIKSRSDNLTELQKQKNATSGGIQGKCVCVCVCACVCVCMRKRESVCVDVLCDNSDSNRILNLK